jgi:transcription initiation factor TFIIIB Brf1 subunit/transcription initiation factor TFIIB
MNTVLLRLFEQYDVSERDRYEIGQIYNFLSEEKKQRLIKDFEIFIKKVKKFQQQLKEEKDILIGETINEIKQIIEQTKLKK